MSVSSYRLRTAWVISPVTATWLGAAAVAAAEAYRPGSDALANTAAWRESAPPVHRPAVRPMLSVISKPCCRRLARFSRALASIASNAAWTACWARLSLRSGVGPLNR